MQKQAKPFMTVINLGGNTIAEHIHSERKPYHFARDPLKEQQHFQGILRILMSSESWTGHSTHHCVCHALLLYVSISIYTENQESYTLAVLMRFAPKLIMSRGSPKTTLSKSAAVPLPSLLRFMEMHQDCGSAEAQRKFQIHPVGHKLSPM